MAHDERFRHWWASYQRRSASPSAALSLARLNTSIDVRHVLPAIRVPTLVLHRRDDLDANIAEGRYIASRIPGAKLVELPGADHLIYVGDQDSIFRQLEDFVRSVRTTEEVDSVLATILTIASDEKENAKKGLASLRSLATRETEWFKGRVCTPENAAFRATFDGPIRAIRAARAVRDGAPGSNIRIGLHTGLCEVRGENVTGRAVEISREVAERATTGQILLTNTVMDLVSGSGIRVSDKGMCKFEGVAEECCLYGLQ